MGLKQSFLNAYDRHYKMFMLASAILLLFCLGFLLYNYATTGEFIKKGVSLKGGLTLTVPTDEDLDTSKLQGFLQKKLPGDVNVRAFREAGTVTAFVVEASDVGEDATVVALKEYGINLEKGKYSAEFLGSTLGKSFFRQMRIAVIIAFIAMAAVVFITFRQLVPSLFVILAAASDILSTLAVVSLLGERLTAAGIAAFLMLTGYSVDTDILLTTRVFKRKAEGGSIFERTVGAMRTGLLMSLTSFAATIIGYIFTQSQTIKEIMLILSIGLVFDIIYTWCQNAGILRWYLEKKERAAQK